MKHRTIYLDGNTSMEEWVDENKEVILNSLYDALPEFIETNDDIKLALKLIVRKNGFGRMSKFNSLAFEFMLVRSDLIETIDGMLGHFESTEEYEKCAQLVKFKKRYEELLKTPTKKARKSKKTDNI